jgi:putative nucleotidyltransferase with HDIG domain
VYNGKSDNLKPLSQHTEARQITMTDEDTRSRLKRAVENLDSLPAMPIIAQKLLALPLNTDEGEEELLKLIGQDPQIYAKLIGMANSPMMGVSRKISSVQDAAMLLGLTRVKSVALGIASMANLSQLAPGKYFNPQDLWLHCMTVAMVMRTIAQFMPRTMRPNEDQIFLAGLLHDIGFMALHHIDVEASDELQLQVILQAERPILEIELETLGITHCFIGSQLAKHWSLPSEIIGAIGYHHPPYVEVVAAKNPLARLINLAEKILPDFGIAEHTTAEILEHEWTELGIDLADVDEICNLANELAVQTSQMTP